MFDIGRFKKSNRNSRYEKQLKSQSDRFPTDLIEETVEESVSNIKEGVKSFVIYGEPQCGKTELMIALTARLLDEGSKFIIILLNDNVQLLDQNLDRFRRSGIDPAPKNFLEIQDPLINVKDGEWIIFAKKNSNNLQKLLLKTKQINNKVVIDDEADFATPNSKVNKGEKNKINELVGKLIGDGIYIGVTATPARLDLNNTFSNDNTKWLYFKPHSKYTGQEVFFPADKLINEGLGYRLSLLPETNDNPMYLRVAMFGFFVNVAHINLDINTKEENFSMLIHTSGKKADHSEDYKQVIAIFNTLKDPNAKNYEQYVKKIWEIAKERYPGEEDIITGFIIENISRNVVVVMNSGIDKKMIDYNAATKPAAMFTIAIGGNIISRGVTFENLLSMFFTRDAKHKIQQDTYIQRARMFGSRGNNLKYFDLTIPAKLYADWSKCFIFHRLSLSAVMTGKGTPVWLEDQRVSTVSRSSIKYTNVDMESGEMSFAMFKYDKKIDTLIGDESVGINAVKELRKIVGDDSFPEYLLGFFTTFMPNGDDSIVIHKTRLVGRDTQYHDTLIRPKGFFGSEDVKKYPTTIHHIMIHKNSYGDARLVYKYNGSIKTLKKRRND